jgi:hypothetical protein
LRFLAEIPAWLPTTLLWIVVGCLFALLFLASLLWSLLGRLGEMAGELEHLRALDDVARDVKRLGTEREDLDLRRIEHVLVDVRDATRRLEGALFSAAERAGRGALEGGTELVPRAMAETLSERVTTRLLALGYDTIQIVTRPEKLSEMAARDGEVLIEARRAGVLHKGRVLVRAGRLTDVEVHPAYSIFP